MASKHADLEPGRVWRAKRSATLLSTIRIVSHTDNRYVWIVDVLPDGGQRKMSDESIRREYTPTAETTGG